jgi:hypothetical protein
VLRALLITSTLLVASCAENPLNPNGLRKLPKSAVDEKLHLSPDDENQIYRLAYKHSFQRISYVSAGHRPNTVELTCGYDDTVYRLTGDTVELEKVGSRWKFIGKGWWVR